MKEKNKVSVIITTKNEGTVILNLLRSLLRQTYQNIEILLIDNYSHDNTQSLAEKYKRVRIYQHGPERSAQRNYGAKHSRGKYLLFLDADMELSPSVVKDCVKAIQSKKKIGGVTISEQSTSKNFWEKVKAFERSFYNLEGDNDIDAARFFSRESFNKTGGYDDTITGPEDWDLSENVQKCGYKITRINSVIKHHERIYSLISLMKKKFYYGLKANRYLKKQGISPFSSKTVYFLRPVFYKNWKILISHPFLALSMFYMMFMELSAGGVGFIVGKFSNEE